MKIARDIMNHDGDALHGWTSTNPSHYQHGNCNQLNYSYHWRRQLWGTGARAPPPTSS